MAEMMGTIRFHLEAALCEADRTEMHAVAALISHALDVLGGESSE